MEPEQRHHLTHMTAYMTLWVDARNAVETGDRLMFTDEDLDDCPDIRTWLQQPIQRAKSLDLVLPVALAGMIDVMRFYSKEVLRRKLASFDLSAFQL